MGPNNHLGAKAYFSCMTVLPDGQHNTQGNGAGLPLKLRGEITVVLVKAFIQIFLIRDRVKMKIGKPLLYPHVLIIAIAYHTPNRKA